MLKICLYSKLYSSSVAREGGSSPSHWPEKYAKYQVFSAFKDDFCSNNENSDPPQWDWRWEDVKNLLWFRPEKWSFFLSGPHLKLIRKTDWIWVKIFFFWDHLISAEKNVSILVKTFFFWRPPEFDKKRTPQSDSSPMKIWVKFVCCCFQLPKNSPTPHCEFLATCLLHSNAS